MPSNFAFKDLGNLSGQLFLEYSAISGFETVIGLVRFSEWNQAFLLNLHNRRERQIAISWVQWLKWVLTSHVFKICRSGFPVVFHLRITSKSKSGEQVFDGFGMINIIPIQLQACSLNFWIPTTVLCPQNGSAIAICPSRRPMASGRLSTSYASEVFV